MKSITYVAIVVLIGLAVITGYSFVDQNSAAALFSGATDQACSGAALSDTTTTCADSSSSVTSLIKTVINILSWVVGIVSIIMIIVGGFRYVISGGDSAAVSSARNTILYALIGLVIAAFAQILVHFVIGKSIHAGTTSTIIQLI